MSTNTATTLEPFYEALVHFLALSKQQLLTIATDYGLTGPQAFMLLLLHEDEMRPMSSFCPQLGCDASNITGIVDGLERKELLARGEQPNDRRIKAVRLLPKGQTVRQAILRRISDQNKSYILSQLTPAEIAAFTNLIQKITAGNAAQQHLLCRARSPQL